MIGSCKARPCIHDHNYLVFPFYFQLCKIIIAIAKCAVKITFRIIKLKDTIIVHQTFFANKTDMFLLIIRSS